MALKRFSEAGIPDPVRDRCVVFFDHFVDEYALTSNEPVTGTSPWIGTALSSGTTAFSTDVVGGVCVLSGAATTDNSGSQIQTDVEAFALQAGKDLVFASRFKVSNAIESHLFAGIGITDTTFLDGADGTACLANTASLGLFSPDDAATLYVIAGNTTIVGQSAVHTLVDDTYLVGEFHVRMDPSVAGAGAVTVFINGNYITTVNMTNLSTTEMAVTLAQVSGTASGTVSATFDYVGVACEVY